MDTAGKTETFWSRNVRLITFLVCLTVFLAVAGPISVFRILDYIEEHQNSDSPMTFSDVVKLSYYGDDLTLNRLTVFDGETAIFSNEIHFSANVDGGKYLLYGVADGSTGRMNYLTLTRLSDEKSANVLKDDLTIVFQ